MIARILCRLFGHQEDVLWVGMGGGVFLRCPRCGSFNLITTTTANTGIVTVTPIVGGE